MYAKSKSKRETWQGDQSVCARRWPRPAAVLILLVQRCQSRIVVEALVELDVLLQRQLLVLQASVHAETKQNKTTSKQ